MKFNVAKGNLFITRNPDAEFYIGMFDENCSSCIGITTPMVSVVYRCDKCMKIINFQIGYLIRQAEGIIEREKNVGV